MTAVRSDAGTGQGAYESEPVRDSGRCPNCGHALADATPPARSRKRAAAPPSPSTAVLTAQAREAHGLAPISSLRRKAAGVLAVVLDGAPNVASARRRLAKHRLPPEVLAAALELLAALAQPDIAANTEQGATHDQA
ncbi:hypothetical protein [Streptomyces phaeochromogenes]